MTITPSFLRRVGKDPVVDWRIILVVGSILILMVIGLGFDRYYGVQQRLIEASDASPNGERVSFDAGRLKTVLDEFARRTVLRTDVIRAYSGPGDPSL